MRIVVMGGLSAVLAMAQVRAVLPNCCSIAQNLSIINPSTGAIERNFSTGAAAPGNTASVAGQSVALLKGGGSVAVLSSGPALTVVDLKTGKTSGPLSLAQMSEYTLAVNPKSGVIYYNYLSGDAPSTLHIQEIDPVTLTVTRDSTVGVFAFAYSGIVVSGDGEKIYVPTASGANVLDAASMQVVGTVTLPSAAYYMAISPDGSTLYVGLQLAFTLDFIDTSTLEVTQAVPIPNPGPIAVSPDGSQIYLGGSVYGEQPALSILNVSTLALATVPTPIQVGQIVVASDGTVYLGQYADGWYGARMQWQMAVFDPISQAVTNTFDLADFGTFAIRADGAELYYLYGESSSLSATAAAPSQDIARTAPAGFLNGAPYAGGSYDAVDHLVLLADATSNVDVYDAGTLAFQGSVQISDSAGFALFGNTGYALTGIYNPIGIVQFDPVSLEVTGSVVSTCPPGGGYSQPVLKGDFLYAPYQYPISIGGDGLPERMPLKGREGLKDTAESGTCSGSGIVVFNTTQMTVAAIWPLPIVADFVIAPGAKEGFAIGYPPLPVFLGKPFNWEVLRINLSTGQILQRLDLPGSSGPTSNPVLSPDGGTIYVGVAGTLYLIDAQTLTIANSVPGWNLNSASITPDGEYIYGESNGCAGCAAPYSVSIFSTSSLEFVGTIPNYSGYLEPIIFVGQ